MKILVTGESGFIGSHVIDNIKAKGYTALSFDRKNPTDYLGDVRDYTSIDEAVANSDGVIHLAAVLGTQETVDNPIPAVETNIIGSLNVFNAVKRHKKKAVYIAVGNHDMLNPYAITKTTAERFALMYNQEFGTKIAVVRGLNAYGPRQKEKPVRKIVPNFIIPALKGEEILIYGDGQQVMDMIYVADLADILVRALTQDHGVYNSVMEAGTGKGLTVGSIADEVVKLVGKGTVKHTAMRPGEPPHAVVVGNPSTLLPLDFTDFTSFKDGLAKTIP